MSTSVREQAAVGLGGVGPGAGVAGQAVEPGEGPGRQARPVDEAGGVGRGMPAGGVLGPRLRLREQGRDLAQPPVGLRQPGLPLLEEVRPAVPPSAIVATIDAASATASRRRFRSSTAFASATARSRSAARTRSCTPAR